MENLYNSRQTGEFEERMRNKQSAISYQWTNPPASPFVKGGQEGDLLKSGIRRERENVFQSAISNQRGIALVMVLILSGIALAIMTGLIYMLTSGTQISGMQKRYKTALEASKGGNDVAHQVINLKAAESDITTFIGNLTFGAITTPAACVVSPITTYTLADGTTCNNHTGDCATWAAANRGLCVKLKLPTECWSGCNSSTTINSADSTTYDMTFQLGTNPAYTGYVKIVDTVWGNSSSSSEDLGCGQGVAGNCAELNPSHVPFLYTIEVDAQNPNNPATERAKLSVMYQF